jgi:predicted DNA-binding protein (MmcQ/YjbR family)
MFVDEVREFALSLPKVTEDFPFDEETLALRIGGKIFALLPLEKSGKINLKCDPERAILLREEFDAIQPGYHMNKKMWNTVDFSQISPALTRELIQHSYNLVLNSLTRKLRSELGL